MKKQKLKIDSRTDQLVTVRDFISRAAYARGFDEEDVSKIALAVDEACTNVIKHAYQYDAKQTITITVADANGYFEISIVDNGKNFKPELIKQPNMKEYLSSYRRGGLGVYLMKSLMDKVEYDIGPGKKNQVRLMKQIPRS